MKKILILTLSLLMLLIFSNTVFAAEEQGSSIETKITANKDGSIDVELPSSLASDNTKISIPTSLSNPVVKFGGEVVTSTYSGGKVIFTGENAGTYTITGGPSTGNSSASYKVVKTSTK